MTPRQKNDAALRSFMTQHGPDAGKWYAGVLNTAGSLPPFDKKTVVAHEAGHLVVGMTLGGGFKHISVYADGPGIWSGWAEIDWPAGIAERTVNVLQQPREATHSLLFKIAGYVGEEVAGLDHAASSPDEVFPTIATCVTVGHFRKIDPEELLTRVMTDARRRILVNIKLFNAIRSAMTLVDSVSPAAMKKLLKQHGLVQVPLEAAW